MQINGTQQAHGAQALRGPHFRGPAKADAPATGAAQPADTLEISSEAQEAARLADAAEARAADRAAQPIRADRVAEIKAQIAEGSYETDAKLDAALDRLLDEIG